MAFAVPPERRRFESGKKVGRPPAPKHLRRVPHSRRPEISPCHPVLVTVRCARGLPSLRYEEAFEVVRASCHAARERFGMRITDFTVQRDHLHLIVEFDPGAPDARVEGLRPGEAARAILSRGMTGLLGRIGKGLNRLWRHRGEVWADRYHAVEKTSPLAVRRAKAYILNNAIHHGRMARGVDPYSSAMWFPPWRRYVGTRDGPAPVVEPRTWLACVGAFRRGPIAIPG
jgi:REP element-mobilizing transposase RayT